MKKIILLTVADSWHHFEEPIAEYEKRLQKELEVILIKPTKSGTSEILRREDTKNIITMLQKYSDSFVIFCDVLGKNPGDTLKFSQFLAEKMGHHKTIIFIIGGAYGLDGNLLKSELDLTISFSEWTLPHGLAVLMLIEQLYRVTNILAGGKYHHE